MENNEKKETPDPIEKSINELFDQSPTARALQAAANAVTSSSAEQVEKNINTLIPRLKHGHVEGGTPGKVKMMVQGAEQEFDLPVAAQLYGVDLGPDFTCCFAVDHGTGYQLLTNGHVAHLNYTRQQLLTRACGNYLREYQSKIQVQQTLFQGVSMIRVDGNTEATTFLFTHLWQQIKEQSKMDRLFVFMPLQDLVLYWNELTDETYENMIRTVTETIKNNPQSRNVSDYVYEFANDRFVSKGKVIGQK